MRSDSRFGAYNVISQSVYPGRMDFSGSLIVGSMLFSDPRMERFVGPPPALQPTLEDGVNITRGYIEACASPLGLEVDPQNCEGLGGRIHVATVTPVQRPSWIRRLRGATAIGGFRWAIPPIEPQA
jgi:hypothetical protein